MMQELSDKDNMFRNDKENKFGPANSSEEGFRFGRQRFSETKPISDEIEIKL
jgi:hypothetical protein